MLKNFSQELKQAREQSDITLQTVAAKTRIDMKFLEALEEGNFNFLPELYVKAFIKQYAKAVGLDEDETIEKYNIAKKGGGKQSSDKIQTPADDEVNNQKENIEFEKPAETTKSFVDENTNQQSTSHDSNKQNPYLIGGIALGAIVISLLVFFLFINNGEEIIVEEKPYEEVLQDKPSRFIEELSDTTKENDIAGLLEELALTIANVDSVDSAWVYVISDGITPNEFLLLPNRSTTVTANNNFRFTLGNSGVIKLVFNNEEIAFDGARGAVRHFKLDRNGLERIYFPPQVNQE